MTTLSAPAGWAVIVVNYASTALLRTNLENLVPGWNGLQVIVVDNFSSDSERTEVRGAAVERGWELVEDSNRGFGAGVNRGADRAAALGCDVVVLLNPDASASPETLYDLASRARHNSTTVVCPTVLKEDGTVWSAELRLSLRTGFTGRPTRFPAAEPVEPWVTGACLAVSLELWNRVDGFDEGYFLYWEDVDFSHRCLRAGATLQVLADVTVTHSVGGTQATGGKTPQYCLVNCRNRLLFASRHLPRLARLRWLLHSVRYAESVVRRGRGRREVLAHPALLVAALRGTIAGSIKVLASLRPGSSR